jgi:hypothetical protein
MVCVRSTNCTPPLLVLAHAKCERGAHRAHQSSIWFIVFRLRYFTLRVNSQYNTRPLFSFTAKSERAPPRVHAALAGSLVAPQWISLALVLLSLQSVFVGAMANGFQMKNTRRSMHYFVCVSPSRSLLLIWPAAPE